MFWNIEPEKHFLEHRHRIFKASLNFPLRQLPTRRLYEIQRQRRGIKDDK